MRRAASIPTRTDMYRRMSLPFSSAMRLLSLSGNRCSPTCRGRPGASFPEFRTNRADAVSSAVQKETNNGQEVRTTCRGRR